MPAPDDDPRSTDARRDLTATTVTVAVTVAVIAVSVAALHGPVDSLALTGDSYQWIQHAHAAAHRPALLVADLDTFYRPSTTWSLVADRQVWGGFEARGYRVSSLALHGLVAVLLVIAGRRLGLGPVAAAIVGVVWVSSPYTDESAFVVAYRFQPLLLAAWLVVIATWPRSGETWRRGRLGLAVLAVLASAAAKESWVVTPALVAALEVERRGSIRDALRAVGAVTTAVVAYVALYFAAFPTSKSYYELGPHVAAKIPQQLAAFLYLDEPMPFELSLTWAGMLATAVVIGMIASCRRWRVDGMWVASALLVLPTLPTLAVPYMPQRYLAIPYAGFLLLAALWLRAAGDRAPRWRTLIKAGAGAVIVLVLIVGGVLVRADLTDYRAMAEAHAALLDEAREVADVVADGAPVVVVRDESVHPLLAVLRDPRGLPKLPYTRHDDPYGLIDAAALFEWVIADEGTRVERIDDWREELTGIEGSVLVHREGGFEHLGTVSDVAHEAARWRVAGRRLRVVRAIALD